MNTTLIHIPAGWTHPYPGSCDCGEPHARRGFRFCHCAGTSGGGHPSWRCYACDRVRMLGCVGAVEVANEDRGRG